MHEHNECKHSNLKYCQYCRVVYCEKCGKEWFENRYWTYPYITYSGYDFNTSGNPAINEYPTVTCKHGD